MVGIGFRTDAPVDIVVFWRVVGWFLAFVSIAKALAAGCLPAAVVVGNDIATWPKHPGQVKDAVVLNVP